MSVWLHDLLLTARRQQLVSVVCVPQVVPGLSCQVLTETHSCCTKEEKNRGLRPALCHWQEGSRKCPRVAGGESQDLERMLASPMSGQSQPRATVLFGFDSRPPVPPIPSVLLTIATGIDYSTKRKWEIEQKALFL